MSLFSKPDPEWTDVTSDPTPVPDSATPVYGFRVWRIHRVMGTLLGTYGPWVPEKNVAECLDRGGGHGSMYQGFTLNVSTTTTQPKKHPAPGRDCRCGFNAADTWEHLDIKAGHHGPPQMIQMSATSGTSYPSWENGNVEDILYPQAAGVAKGWGRVAIHSGGWRSQYAEIVALVDFCAVLPWFDRDEKYHLLLEHTAKRYGVPVMDRIPDPREFE